MGLVTKTVQTRKDRRCHRQTTMRESPSGLDGLISQPRPVRPRLPQQAIEWLFQVRLGRAQVFAQLKIKTSSGRSLTPAEAGGYTTCGLGRLCRFGRWQAIKNQRPPVKKRSARDNTLRILDYLGGRCADCRRVYPIYVYDLHCSESRMDIKSFAGTKLRPFDEIKDDLDNCVLLCGNCHRIRHHEKR